MTTQRSTRSRPPSPQTRLGDLAKWIVVLQNIAIFGDQGPQPFREHDDSPVGKYVYFLEIEGKRCIWQHDAFYLAWNYRERQPRLWHGQAEKCTWLGIAHDYELVTFGHDSGGFGEIEITLRASGIWCQ